MDRRDAYPYERYDDESYYSGGAGYSPDDEHYHYARNLTNEFEQEYQRDRGGWDDARPPYRPHRSYHEGDDMGDAYERRSRAEASLRDRSDYMRARDRGMDYAGSHSRDRDSRHPGDYGRYQQRYSGQGQHSTMGQGYGGTYGRYDSVGSDDIRSAWGEQDGYSGSGDDYRRPRYSDRGYGSRGSSRDNWHSSDWSGERF